MRSSLALILLLCVSACGLLPEQIDETKNWSAEKIYTTAKERLDSGQYELAIKMYEKLEARYPYGRFAQQAQLEVAYAYYKDREIASAITAAERFIKLHPNHPNVDYAYFLRGLANFNDDLGLLGSYAGQDMSERDPKAAREAFNAFKDLVTRFPNSKYAADSVQRLNYLVNTLALNEIHVARYYMKRSAYVAAANRAQYALKTYPQATANEEGLLIMVQAYDKLGLTDLRNDAERVMKANFPNSKFLTGKVGSAAPWWQVWNW
jgi:outer membrane protein assembly factor BamD